MSNIFKILTVLILATLFVSAQPVCSKRVVSELTSGTKFAVSSSDEDFYIIKIHSVDEHIIKAWTIDILTQAGRKKYLKFSAIHNKIGYSKTLRAYDHYANSWTDISSVDYDCNGNVIISNTQSRPDFVNMYEHIVPGSLEEALMEAVIEMLEEQAR